MAKEAFKTANKHYFSLPESLRQAMAPEDWRQEAFLVFHGLLTEFDPSVGKLENFVRFHMGRRLTDLTRKLYRSNPATDDDVRKAAEKLRRELKREPTPEEVARQTHREPEAVREILERGFGDRRVVPLTAAVAESDAFKAESRNPEEMVLAVEEARFQDRAQTALGNCVEKLESHERYAFIKKEFEGVSLRKLYAEPWIPPAFTAKSYKTFQQKRYPAVFQKVERCVKKQLAETTAEGRKS